MSSLQCRESSYNRYDFLLVLTLRLANDWRPHFAEPKWEKCPHFATQMWNKIWSCATIYGYFYLIHLHYYILCGVCHVGPKIVSLNWFHSNVNHNVHLSVATLNDIVVQPHWIQKSWTGHWLTSPFHRGQCKRNSEVIQYCVHFYLVYLY